MIIEIIGKGEGLHYPAHERIEALNCTYAYVGIKSWEEGNDSSEYIMYEYKVKYRVWIEDVR